MKAFPAIYEALASPDKQRVVLIAHSQGTIVAAVLLRLLKMITRREPRPGEPLAAAAYAPPEFIFPSDEPLDAADFAPLEESQLAKLEIYCFATCANVVTHLRPAQKRAGAPCRTSSTLATSTTLWRAWGCRRPTPRHGAS